MSNIRYKKLVKDFYLKGEEGVIQWLVVTGQTLNKKRKVNYLEKNILKTIRTILKNNLVKKSERVNDLKSSKISPYGPKMPGK